MAVTGFSKIPSGVASTTALVPSTMWNCLRSQAGMTTCPLAVNQTSSDLNVALTVGNLIHSPSSVNKWGAVIAKEREEAAGPNAAPLTTARVRPFRARKILLSSVDRGPCRLRASSPAFTLILK
jgi:hypothetical protein